MRDRLSVFHWVIIKLTDSSTNLDDVLIALRRVIRATDLHSKKLAKTSGLTAPQILVMRAIETKGRRTIGSIAENITVSQATVTNIVDRLSQKDLVYRERAKEDRRKVYVYLTSVGEELLKHAPTPLQEQFSIRFSKLAQWEQHMMVASLQRIADMMDANLIDAAPMLDVGKLDRQNLS